MVQQPCFGSLKRKRGRPKTVRFSPKEEILYTYASTDYDRGGIFAQPVLYKINPSVLTHKPKLSLSIPPPSLCRSEDSSSSTFSNSSCESDSNRSGPADQGYPLLHSQAPRRPKLSIDTSMCEGPLFYTHTSTNYVGHKVGPPTTAVDDPADNHFLVPLSASI